MNEHEPQTWEQWAGATFGSSEWGDQQRTDQLVKMATALAHEPVACLPNAMGSWADTLAASRFLDTEQVSHEQDHAAAWELYHCAITETRGVLMVRAISLRHGAHQYAQWYQARGHTHLLAGQHRESSFFPFLPSESTASKTLLVSSCSSDRCAPSLFLPTVCFLERMYSLSRGLRGCISQGMLVLRAGPATSS